MSPPSPGAPRRAEIAADRIRDGILRGTWRAGDRLPGERDMAARLGVHRGTVREALIALEHQGLVSTRPGGTVVCAIQEAGIGVLRHLLSVEGAPNRALIGHLLDVHEMLFAGAARLAVERGSRDDLIRAEELVAKLADPVRSRSSLAELLDDIAELITRASGNLVLQLWRNTLRPALADHLDLLRDRLAPDASVLARLSRGIRERDGAATEESVRALLRQRHSELMAALDAPRDQ
jgi:GntR family transcriptional repressor for pyruvate dehydrogenase complex